MKKEKELAPRTAPKRPRAEIYFSPIDSVPGPGRGRDEGLPIERSRGLLVDAVFFAEGRSLRCRRSFLGPD